ncbi:MAG: DNA polymerase III subunit beta [Candidatus Omnitrophota bacterium]|jgi:DNA polymerase-3 subunit beta
MELRIQKSLLAKAVGLVGNVAAQRANTLPILGNILLETTKEGNIQMVGTDLEVGISTAVPATILAEGSITVPAKKLTEIIRELPECEVEISVAKNNAVSIKAEKAYFKIMGLSKEDYPKLPEWKLEDGIEMEQASLREGLALTSFAISSDETRYVLNGVLVSVKGKKIRFVATDGRRLAFIEKDFENAKAKSFDMIVPTKAVHELLKMLTWDGIVHVIATKNQAVFSMGDSYLSTRLIEGNFPNYEQVIPKEEKTSSVANREELLQAIRRTSLLTSPESPAVKMDFVKGKILISSRSPNMGEAKEELPAEMKGNEMAIGFNPQYLIDVLRNLDVEKIGMSLTDPDKPGLVQGKDGYLYVVMPMQLT